jgi:hypothetical protein
MSESKGQKRHLTDLQASLILGNPNLVLKKDALDDDRQGLMDRIMKPGRCWDWLTSKDPVTGKQLIWTRDEKDKERPTKPFPNLAYLRAIIELFEEFKFCIIEKARQMIISTTCCLFISHEAQTVDARRWLISRTIEKDAKELIRDKVRAPWYLSPKWYQEASPISEAPMELVHAKNTDSYIQAVSENVANRSARGGTASGFLLDEAAFQDQSRDIVTAAAPMAARILMVSTPSMRPGGRFMHKKIKQAREGGKEIDIDRLIGHWGDRKG